MTDRKLFIPILLGTVRDGRLSEGPARYIKEKLQTHPEIETKLFDVREFKFPEHGYGEEIKGEFSEYRDAILRADGLLIVSPEYNHGYPGDLKKVLDLLLKEYTHRTVAVCGVSSGGGGGRRMIEQIAGVVRELGLVITSIDLHVAQGAYGDEAFDRRLQGFLKELIWMAKTLRWGRENLQENRE